jgi:hypothetical protein
VRDRLRDLCDWAPAPGHARPSETGALARRRPWAGWRSWQPHLLGGSCIALVTGVLIAETGNPVCWLLPAAVGQVPIALAKRRLHTADVPLAPARA